MSTLYLVRHGRPEVDPDIPAADWPLDPEHFDGTVRRALADPDRAAHDGWEPLANTRDRVLTAVRGLLEAHPGDDLLLVGHGTAWTVLEAALTGRAPDFERWRSLRMPDVMVVRQVTTTPGDGPSAAG